MEIKIKYQYSYFIYPYKIEQKKYEKYLCGLIENENYKIKIFQKEKDLDIYKFFNSEIKHKYFSSFYYAKNDENLEEKILKSNCTIFEYELDEKLQNIDKDEKGIKYKVPKIEIVCFKPGICFLILKTYIEDYNDFRDLLNFNYKFKDIHSELANLKEYRNINIKNKLFNNDYIIDLIENITKNKMENRRFHSYNYACITSEHWNNEINNVENDFIKYSYLKPHNLELNYNKNEALKIINKYKYLKIGITKKDCSFFTNDMEIYNYTKLISSYENEYLYNYILNLFKKECEQNYKKRGLEEITDDEIGAEINNNLNKLFKKEQHINEDTIINKYKRTTNIVIVLLIISLIINIVNYIN